MPGKVVRVVTRDHQCSDKPTEAEVNSVDMKSGSLWQCDECDGLWILHYYHGWGWSRYSLQHQHDELIGR